MTIDTIIGIVVLGVMAVLSFTFVTVGLLMLDDIDDISR